MGELINILDQLSEMVTMGALLSVRSNEYAAVGVRVLKNMERNHKAGEMIEVVGLADGERVLIFEG